jgi:hypothetical protein
LLGEMSRKLLHENGELLTRLKRDARKVALHFGLSYRAIEAERANVKSRYGICYDDGTIRIRLRHAVSGEPLKYSSLVATLCHELAHLRYFDHSERFKRFNQEVLDWARREGIYRPSRRAPAAYPPSPGTHPAQASGRGTAPLRERGASPQPVGPPYSGRGVPPLPSRAGVSPRGPALPSPAASASAGGRQNEEPPERTAPEQLSLFG